MKKEFGFGVRSESFDTLCKFKEAAEGMGWKLTPNFGLFSKEEWGRNPDIWFDTLWEDENGEITDLGFSLSNVQEGSLCFDIDDSDGWESVLDMCAETIDNWDPFNNPELTEKLGFATLYYTIEKDWDVETESKFVSVYRIINNIPRLTQTKELDTSDVTVEWLQEEYPCSNFIKL
jgi:hypothetical protein